MSEHFFKLHFCMFVRSQGKHNSLDCHKKVLEYIFIIAKFDINIKTICMFKTLKSPMWTMLFFPNIIFFTKCAPFILKIEDDFNIVD